MQQFFIREVLKGQSNDEESQNYKAQLQSMITNKQSLDQIEQLNVWQLRRCFEACCAIIIEENNPKFFVLLHLLLTQIYKLFKASASPAFSSEQHLETCIQIQAQLIQVTNTILISDHYDSIIYLFNSLTKDVDSQFWNLISWYFKNNPKNLHQLHFLSGIIKFHSDRLEFVLPFYQIFAVKLNLEITQPHPPEVHSLLLSSVYTLLTLLKRQTTIEISDSDFFITNLFQFLSTLVRVQVSKELANVLILLDLIYEERHLIEQQPYSIFVLSILDPLLAQITNRETHTKYGLLLLIQYTNNPFIQERYKVLQYELFQFIFREVNLELLDRNTVEGDFLHELYDITHKRKSDNRLATLVKLFTSLASNLITFSLLSTTYLLTLVRLAFNKGDNCPYEYQLCDIRFVHTPEFMISSVDIQLLETALVLLSTLHRTIKNNSYLLSILEANFRDNLVNLTAVQGKEFYSCILLSYFSTYFNKILKADEDMCIKLEIIKFIINQQIQNNQAAFQIFKRITKSKRLYNLLDNILGDIHPQLIYLIKNVQEQDFLDSVENLCVIHNSVAERYMEDYLLALQDRISEEAQKLTTQHMLLLLLHTYEVLLEIYLRENTCNLKLDVPKILGYFDRAKELNIVVELISISSIYFKSTQIKHLPQIIYVLRFVFNELSQQAFCNMECYSFLSNLTSYCSAYLYDTDPAIIKEILDFCCKALLSQSGDFSQAQQSQAQSEGKLLKQTIQNVIKDHAVPDVGSFESGLLFQCMRQYQHSDLFYLFCATYQEESEKYHNELMENLQRQVWQGTVMFMKKSCEFLLAIFKYYSSNYGKCLREYEMQILELLTECLHRYLLGRERKQKKLNQLIFNFQDLMAEQIAHRSEALRRVRGELASRVLQFKFDQLMEAKSQYGLLNDIYKKFII